MPLMFCPVQAVKYEFLVPVEVYIGTTVDTPLFWLNLKIVGEGADTRHHHKPEMPLSLTTVDGMGVIAPVTPPLQLVSTGAAVACPCRARLVFMTALRRSRHGDFSFTISASSGLSVTPTSGVLPGKKAVIHVR